METKGANLITARDARPFERSMATVLLRRLGSTALQPSRRVLGASDAVVERIVADYLRPGVINLAPGSAHWSPPLESKRLFHSAWRAEHSRYGACHGTPELLSALRTKLAAHNGHDMTLREVMVTNGANQAYVSALLALCDPGDEARATRT